MKTTIKDFDGYNMKMAKGIIDKLFFMDMAIDFDTVVDFGCANGELLKHVNFFDPDLKLYGYDNYGPMIEAAKKNCPQAEYISSFDCLKKTDFGKNAVLILSSVIHEVYSYQSSKEIEEFWKLVFSGKFKYVSIRDMSISTAAFRSTAIDDEIKVRNGMRQKFNYRFVEEFEKIWGSLANNKNFIHFLLKYKYWANWEREVRENYFPLTTDELMEKIPDNYEIVIYNRYVLPYLNYQVENDFDIKIKDHTHLKLLLKRR